MTIEETVSQAAFELFHGSDSLPTVAVPVIRYTGATVYETVGGFGVETGEQFTTVETVGEALALIRLDCAGRRASSRFNELAGN